MEGVRDKREGLQPSLSLTHHHVSVAPIQVQVLFKTTKIRGKNKAFKVL